MSKKQERQPRIIRELLKKPENKKCFDCPSKGPAYVNLFNDTFICAKCSGLHREFNHRVKSITASIFTPAEVESLKGGGNAKAAEIWLAKFTWMDFPEPDPDDIESIRDFMSMKYEQKKWLDESLLKAKNKKPSNSEYYESKGTFIINPPALNNKFNNSNSNLSDDSSSQNSSLNDHSPVSHTSRKSSSSTSDLSDNILNNINYLKYSSDSYFNDSISPKPNSNNNMSSLLFGPDNNHKNVKNELDDLFDTWDNSSNQHYITKRNNIYPEPNKSSPSSTSNTNTTTTNSFFTQTNLLENRRRSETYPTQNLLHNNSKLYSNLNSNANTNMSIFSTRSSLLNNNEFNLSSVNYNQNNDPFGHVNHSSLNSITSDNILKPKPALSPISSTLDDPYMAFRELTLNDNVNSKIINHSNTSTTSNLHSKRSINNSNSIVNDPFSDLLPPTKSETSRRFSPQKLDDNDIFSDFQTAPDNNSQQTIYSTNLNTFPNGSSNVNQNQFNNNLHQAQQKYSFFPSSSIANTSISNTNINSLQQKQFNHSKSISFDSVFNDLDPLRNN